MHAIEELNKAKTHLVTAQQKLSEEDQTALIERMAWCIQQAVNRVGWVTELLKREREG